MGPLSQGTPGSHCPVANWENWERIWANPPCVQHRCPGKGCSGQSSSAQERMICYQEDNNEGGSLPGPFPFPASCHDFPAIFTAEECVFSCCGFCGNLVYIENINRPGEGGGGDECRGGFRRGRQSKIIESNLQQTAQCHLSKCHICSHFERFQGW